MATNLESMEKLERIWKVDPGVKVMHYFRFLWVHVGAREWIIAGKSGGIISRYASHC